MNINVVWILAAKHEVDAQHYMNAAIAARTQAIATSPTCQQLWLEV